jgi:hypothetical protein
MIISSSTWTLTIGTESPSSFYMRQIHMGILKTIDS